jgi:solute carrier family 25 carnitine/acylcarnitine transporter 20/29
MKAAQGVGAVGTFCSIWHTQGFTGFYRGIAGPLIAQAVYKSLIFTTNSIVHSELARRRCSYYTATTTNYRGNTTSSINWTVFLSGMVAGTVNAFVVAPVEMIRTHQILSGKSFLASFRSFRWDSTHNYYRNNVSFGCSTNSSSSSPLRWVLLWRGILPTILRDGPGIGLYFLTFESTKVLVHNYFYLNTNGLEDPQHQQRPQPIWCTLLAGSLAGIAFWIWALPLDTIKSNIEASFSSAPSKTNTTTSADTNAKYSSSEWQWIRLIRGKGLIHLLRAWPVALGRGIPSAAVTLTTYDIITQYLIQYRSFRT